MSDMIKSQQLYVCNQWLRRLREENGELRDEIERLRAQVSALREALEEIANLKKPLSEKLRTPSDYARGWVDARYRAAEIARAALEGK